MAELTWTLENGGEASLVFDATVRDSHIASATITEHPVEDGVAISDHIRPDLDRVTLNVVVSNTPIASPADHNDGVTGQQTSVELTGSNGETLTRALVLAFNGTLTRVRSVYEELLSLMKGGTLVNVLTSLREYEGMAIANVSPVREADSGNALVATVEFKQVRIVESEIVEAPEPREPRGNTERERGRENTEDEGEQGQSLLASLTDSFTGLFQ